MLPHVNRTRFSGIYAIRHVVSGKFYVGSAKNFFYRWQVHRKQLNEGRHHSPHLQRVWDKYGPDVFAWEVLEVAENKTNLLPIEQEYLDHFETWKRSKGYNISRYADAPMRGRKASAESRAKMSAFQKGRPKSAEHRAKIGNANRGRVISEEGRANMSAAHIGKPISPDSVAKRSATIRGRARSPEHCAAISSAKMGHEVSDETRAKIAAALTGRKRGPHSPETRAKMSAAAKGRQMSAEARAKMSASRLAKNAAKRLAQQSPPDGQMTLPFAD